MMSILSFYKNFRRKPIIIRESYVNISRSCCIVITYTLLLQSLVTSTVLYINNFEEGSYFSIFCLICHTLVAILATRAHWLSMFTDPGYIPNVKDDDINDHSLFLALDFCNRCESLRPQGAHHCRICQRCVLRMDHHCPWIANCIGHFNLKYFILYNVYIQLLAILDVSLFGIHFSKIFRVEQNYIFGSETIVLFLILCFISVVFLVFTAIILFDQFKAIYTSSTKIDRLKGVETNNASPMEYLRQIFGEEFSYKWFLPVKPKLSPTYPTPSIYGIFFNDKNATISNDCEDASSDNKEICIV